MYRPELTSNDSIIVDCLEVTQPVGQFYIAAMNHEVLLFISYADRRIIGKGNIDNYLENPEIKNKFKVITLPTKLLQRNSLKNRKY